MVLVCSMLQTIVVTCLHTTKLHIDEQIWWREKEETVLLIFFLIDGVGASERFSGQKWWRSWTMWNSQSKMSSLIPLLAPQIFSSIFNTLHSVLFQEMGKIVAVGKVDL